MNRDYHAFRRQIRTVLLLVFLFSQPSRAWIQRTNHRSASPAQHVFFSRPKLSGTSVLQAQDKDSLDLLYKTVAEQDPEWYHEFVRDILGAENDELHEPPTATTTTEKEFKRKDDTRDFPQISTVTVNDTYSEVGGARCSARGKE